MGVIHVKGRPQDDVGPNHADDVGTDPLFIQHAQQPGFLAKASCSIASKSEAIADRCENDEVGVSWSVLDRQDDGREKDHGVSPQIAHSPR